MKDPYGVLGLARTASPEQLKAKYEELHAIYGEQRFKAGEEGNEGARKLQELEEAWVLISANIEHDQATSEFSGDYGKVDELIRNGKYNEAQDILDSVQDRGGEWHYMQAIVFYKREWLTEAKTQLEMALRDDPNNPKYRSSLDKLNMTINGVNSNNTIDNGSAPNGNPYNNNRGGYNNVPPPYTEQPQGQDLSNCLSTCCCAYCLTDCLCSAMRCC